MAFALPRVRAAAALWRAHIAAPLLVKSFRKSRLRPVPSACRFLNCSKFYCTHSNNDSNDKSIEDVNIGKVSEEKSGQTVASEDDIAIEKAFTSEVKINREEAVGSGRGDDNFWKDIFDNQMLDKEEDQEFGADRKEVIASGNEEAFPSEVEIDREESVASNSDDKLWTKIFDNQMLDEEEDQEFATDRKEAVASGDEEAFPSEVKIDKEETVARNDSDDNLWFKVFDNQMLDKEKDKEFVADKKEAVASGDGDDNIWKGMFDDQVLGKKEDQQFGAEEKHWLYEEDSNMDQQKVHLFNDEDMENFKFDTSELDPRDILDTKRTEDDVRELRAGLGDTKQYLKELEKFPVMYVRCSQNNTYVDICAPNGNILTKKSAGSIGFKNSRKGTAFAAQSTGQAAALKAGELGIKRVRVKLKGLGIGRQHALKGFQLGGLEIMSLQDVTPVPHNGCRPKKKRRI